MLKCVPVKEIETYQAYLRFYADRVGALESVLHKVTGDFADFLQSNGDEISAENVRSLFDIIDLPIETQIVLHYAEEPEQQSPIPEVVHRKTGPGKVINIFNKQEI